MSGSSAGPVRAALLVALATAISLPGCGGSGESEVDRQKRVQGQAVGSLSAAGAKTTQKKYPQGDAWAVDLSGATVSEAVIADLKRLGRITELDLSKSTITDVELPALNEPSVCGLILKLNLSQTAVSDAGLEKLTNLILLQELNLKGTKVTPAGVERFRKARQADTKIMPAFKSPKIQL